jgi:hypothetical protein
MYSEVFREWSGSGSDIKPIKGISTALPTGGGRKVSVDISGAVQPSTGKPVWKKFKDFEIMVL